MNMKISLISMEILAVSLRMDKTMSLSETMHINPGRNYKS